MDKEEWALQTIRFIQDSVSREHPCLRDCLSDGTRDVIPLLVVALNRYLEEEAKK